jgi:hypothetical protein
MTAEWTRFARTRDFDVDGSAIRVRFADERHHKVEVQERAEHYVLRAIVARPSIASQGSELPVHVWRRNRATRLVGFRVDARGRLVGEAFVPKAGLSAEEFQLYVRNVAAESDRFEYLLTGRDVE